MVICHNRRSKRNRVCKGLAGRGKSSTGWFYGFKVHIVINNLGEIVNLKITSGSIHDIAVLESLTKELKGILLGDKGYLSKEKTEALAARGLRILTPSSKNMKINPSKLKKKNNCFAEED